MGTKDNTKVEMLYENQKDITDYKNFQESEYFTPSTAFLIIRKRLEATVLQ